MANYFKNFDIYKVKIGDEYILKLQCVVNGLCCTVRVPITEPFKERIVQMLNNYESMIRNDNNFKNLDCNIGVNENGKVK